MLVLDSGLSVPAEDTKVDTEQMEQQPEVFVRETDGWDEAPLTQSGDIEDVARRVLKESPVKHMQSPSAAEATASACRCAGGAVATAAEARGRRAASVELFPRAHARGRRVAANPAGGQLEAMAGVQATAGVQSMVFEKEAVQASPSVGAKWGAMLSPEAQKDATSIMDRPHDGS